MLPSGSNQSIRRMPWQSQKRSGHTLSCRFRRLNLFRRTAIRVFPLQEFDLRFKFVETKLWFIPGHKPGHVFFWVLHVKLLQLIAHNEMFLFNIYCSQGPWSLSSGLPSHHQVRMHYSLQGPSAEFTFLLYFSNCIYTCSSGSGFTQWPCFLVLSQSLSYRICSPRRLTCSHVSSYSPGCEPFSMVVHIHHTLRTAICERSVRSWYTLFP